MEFVYTSNSLLLCCDIMKDPSIRLLVRLSAAIFREEGGGGGGGVNCPKLFKLGVIRWVFLHFSHFLLNFRWGQTCYGRVKWSFLESRREALAARNFVLILSLCHISDSKTCC